MAATAESGPPKLLDRWTIAAIAVSAAVITDFVHEGLGHGGLCVATGAQPMVLSTVHFQCSADTRLVAAGGTLANLIFGAVFWAAARGVKRAATWRYFFWLQMTFNLFDAGGYFLFPESATSVTGLWWWRVASRRGPGASVWLHWERSLISFCLFLCACVSCVRTSGGIRKSA